MHRGWLMSWLTMLMQLGQMLVKAVGKVRKHWNGHVAAPRIGAAIISIKAVDVLGSKAWIDGDQ